MAHSGASWRHAILSLLASMPALFYAYLGSFSRLYADDYVRIGLPMDIGAWETMLYLREVFNGDYTNFLVFGLLSPWGSNITRVFPLFLILVTILGFSWLINTALSWAQFGARRRLAAAGLASLVIPAIIHGMPDLEAIYWYTASVEYYLPVALLPLGVAMAVETARQTGAAAVLFRHNSDYSWHAGAPGVAGQSLSGERADV